MNIIKSIAALTIGALATALLAVTPAHAAGNLQSVCAAAFVHARIIQACEEVQGTSHGFHPTGYRGRDVMRGSDASGTGWRFVENSRGYHKATQLYSFYGQP